MNTIIFLGSFFSISGDDVATMTAYTGDLLESFEPILLAIVGVGLALIVVYTLISIFKK
jgi:type II secretory pathway component PulF